MSFHYRAAPFQTVLTIRLDVLTAIYHRSSGQTHLVASPAPEILAALGDAELDVDALLDRLRGDFDLVDADRDLLVARLDELIETGLVERR